MLDQEDNDFFNDDDASWGGLATKGDGPQESIKDIIARGVQEGAETVEKMSEEDFQKLLEQIDEGKTLAEIREVDPNALEALYAFGYNFYVNGRYREALLFFQHLVMLDHLEKRYYFGVAGCLQALKFYAQALDTYSVLFFLDESNPNVAYNAGLCNMALGDLENARYAFDMAGELLVAQLEEHPEYEELGDRIVALLANLDERENQKKNGSKK